MFASKTPAPQAKPEASARRAAKPAPPEPQARPNPLWFGLALCVQPKLAVGAREDPLERKADATAERVLGMACGTAPPALSAAPGKAAQRKCACAAEDEEQTKLQRKESAQAPASVDQALSGPGEPLDAAARAYFEPRFGQYFGAVRVRQGPAAAQSAREVGARAYTAGSDIVFASGQYAPGTAQGKRLLAHELAHVVQQGGGAAGGRAGQGAQPALSRAPAAAVQRDPPQPPVQSSWTPKSGGDYPIKEIDPRVRKDKPQSPEEVENNTPPPPVGWKYWPKGKNVGPQAKKLSDLTYDPSVVIGSFIQDKADGEVIAVRIEWHSWTTVKDKETGKIITLRKVKKGGSLMVRVTEGNVQPKLEVGAADDPLEKEADAATERVLQMPSPQALPAGSRLAGGQTSQGQAQTSAPGHGLSTPLTNQGSGRQIVSRQTYGTANTTAPPAKNESPGDVFRGRLKDEVGLFDKAGVILDWIISERAGGATVTSFFTSSLLASADTMKKLKPTPKTDADLEPPLRMLEYYEVVKAKGPGEWEIVLAPLQLGQTQQDVNRAKFDSNRKDIAAFQKNFEQRFDDKGHPVKPLVQQELLDDNLAAGSSQEKKAEKDAKTKRAKVSDERGEYVAILKKGNPIYRVTTDNPPKVTQGTTTNVLLPVANAKKPVAVEESNLDRIESIATGKSPEVEKRRKDIEARLKKADQALFDAQGFHRFSTEMVWFLRQLTDTSSVKFTAGTYGRHGRFGEYAADMFPAITVDSRGFYAPGLAEQFVDAINQVAEAGHPYYGKFSWQIVYNDETLQAKINAKYGRRMSSAPHHGPAPDKLHMHLDIRPLKLVGDEKTGFHENSSGRVELY